MEIKKVKCKYCANIVEADCSTKICGECLMEIRGDFDIEPSSVIIR